MLAGFHCLNTGCLQCSHAFNSQRPTQIKPQVNCKICLSETAGLHEFFVCVFVGFVQYYLMALCHIRKCLNIHGGLTDKLL